MIKILIPFLLSFSLMAREKPVSGHVDLQVHLTTHMVYPLIVGRTSPLSPEPRKPLSHKHTCEQAAYQDRLWESSTSLYVIATLDNVFNQGRRHTKKQFKDNFVLFAK